MLDFIRFFYNEVDDLHYLAIKHFFSNSFVPKAWSKTYLALIPKKDNPKLVYDFYLISLYNV